MTRGAALFLALGFAAAAFLYGGVWEYGDGFIYNRFNGQVVYVELPEPEDAVQLGIGAGIASRERGTAERLARRGPRALHASEMTPPDRIALHRVAP